MTNGTIRKAEAETARQTLRGAFTKDGVDLTAIRFKLKEPITPFWYVVYGVYVVCVIRHVKVCGCGGARVGQRSPRPLQGPGQGGVRPWPGGYPTPLVAP